MEKYAKLDFASLKNKHAGQEAIFFGSGPTIKDFKLSMISDQVLVGVNEVIFTEFELDYLFVGDAGDSKFNQKLKQFHEYKPKIGKYVGRDERQILDIIALLNGQSLDGSEVYSTKKPAKRGDLNTLSENPINKNIARWGSISFDVMQILPWMGFKKIYLVGHDCNYRAGTFHTNFDGGTDVATGKLIPQWNCMKAFLEKYYPELEVFSINPVDMHWFPNATKEFFPH